MMCVERLVKPDHKASVNTDRMTAWSRGRVQFSVQHLPSMCRALDFNANTQTKQEKK